MALVYPVPSLWGKKPETSSGFGPRESGFHPGSDIMYRRGDSGRPSLPVYTKHYKMPYGVNALAVGNGKVTTAKRVGTGYWVELVLNNGWRVAYGHLDKIRVTRGQRVIAGQPIGIIWENPLDPNDPAHLHFQLWINGQLVDPDPYIRKLPVRMDPDFLALGLAIGVGFAFYKFLGP